MALNFSLPDPYNYYPTFVAAGTGTAASFTAGATGDLDCDDVRLAPSSASARVNATSGDVVGGGAPAVTNELE